MEQRLRLLAQQWFPTPLKNANSAEQQALFQKCKELLDQLNRRGAHVCYFADENYPESLQSLPNPPLALTYFGTPVWTARNSMAVVGSRNPGGQTLQWMDEHLPAVLRGENLILVSGGARGIDQKAHSICIRNNIPTVCFIPSGLFDLYPKVLEKFIQPIVESGGAVISQFSPLQPMFKSHFYARNRLIAGMSDYVFIAEAKLRSGSMLTAKMSLDMGRPIGTLPFFPSDLSGAGSLQLIYDGADMIKNSDDLKTSIQMLNLCN